MISILSRFNFITGTIHIAKASYTLYEFTLFLLLIFGIVFGISRFLLLKNKYSLIWVFICLVGFFMLFCGVYGYADELILKNNLKEVRKEKNYLNLHWQR